MFHFTSFSCLMQNLHLIDVVLLKRTSCCVRVMVNYLSLSACNGELSFSCEAVSLLWRAVQALVQA